MLYANKNFELGGLYMSAIIRYEFDAERQVLIKCSSEDSPKIIEKSNLHWRDFGAQDEAYARAIFLGQGCWERLDSITEDEVQTILTRWGYSKKTNAL